GRSCTATFNLPAGGVIVLSNGEKVTLTDDAAFRPSCTPQIAPAIIANGGGPGVSMDETTSTTDLQGSDFRDPFYASTFPQSYALAATTVVAYTLVIMLFITPRSFLDGGVVVLGRKGFTNGGNGTNIGGRPWLQKVAALTVAISLTIATANTFKVAADQYSNMIENASQLQQQVLGGTELKVIRIISNSFLWLAQAQTLIRLFPRQREKIIIKWTAFALITLDVIFQSLNSFQYTTQGQTRPQNFTEAVPALSYLFELALGVLYAAWVIYYSLMKKRYAFYHQKMRNVGLVAGLSLISILVPIVFFILDVSKPEFTVWGDYVRWVGAAAASVIVWEWVERIEALEREEKKDGILGREVFDGDEMMEITPSDFSWPRKRKNQKDGGDAENGKGGQDGGLATGRGNLWPTIGPIASRYRSRPRPDNSGRNGEPRSTESSNNDRIRFLQPPLWPARPAPAVTPISRTDTASAASTVYAIRYRPLTETSGATPPPIQENDSISRSNSITSHRPSERGGNGNTAPPAEQPSRGTEAQDASSGSRWRALAQGISFPRVTRPGPPESVRQAKDNLRRRDYDESNRWDIRARFEDFAMSQAERLRERMRPTPDTASLPVMVIPAPARRGAALAQLREEEE
ncbi:PalH-domain-containing protein, partial [Thozetella sp. PMI_491]